jgi:glucose/arabinose dehydrogenase
VFLLLLFGVSAPPASAATIERRTVLVNLNFPVAFQVAPNNRIFYAERTGIIRVFDPATGEDKPFFTIPNVAAETGEQGLLGLALHPNYPATPHIFAYATRRVNGVLQNHIVRIINYGGVGTSMAVILGIGAARGHNGGRIQFGPDGHLYVLTGENEVKSLSQDITRREGKILRITPSGGIPFGNPFGNHVFAYGIRNGIGMDFDPQSGLLWQTDNGPQCNDELNLIRSGRNYGWGPSESCLTGSPPENTNRDGPLPVMPKQVYVTTVAPTGAAFCEECNLGAGAEGRLFYGRLNTHELRVVTLDESRQNVVSDEPVFTFNETVLSVETGPDGTIYFSTYGAIYKLVASK